MKPSSSEAEATGGGASDTATSRPRMYGFSRLPSWWIQDGRLNDFKVPNGLPTLKTLVALAIIKGRFQRRRIGRGLEFFPASITELAEIAGTHRMEIVRSLDLLKSLKLIQRLELDPTALEAPRRTAVYGFTAPVTPFLPLPFVHLERAEFPSSLRLRSATNLAALKIYLLLGAFRNNRDGCTMLGYEKIIDYSGLKRIDIPRALNLLVTAGLVATRQPDFENEFFATRYFLRGLNKAPHLSRGDAGTPLKHLPSPHLYTRGRKR